MFRFFFALVFLFLFSCKTNQLPQNGKGETAVAEIPVSEPVITLGDEVIGEKELDLTLSDFAFSDSSDYQQAIQQYLIKKRLYLEAIAEGYGDNDTHQEELESYTSLLAKSFIITPEKEEELALLTYNRLKWELNASHLLIAVHPYAAPSDTLKAYQAIQALREELMHGADFDSLAQQYSADINTREQGGNMGWFSALQLIFPLEDAAYSLQKGEISQPVRSSAGFHLIKLNDKRPYSGKVRVQHILKAVDKSDSEEVAIFQKNEIDSLYALLEKGASFEELCQANSDDLYSREKGGILEPFSIGSRVEESFEKAAFALQPGEISEPVKSQVGWHIIKLVEKLPLPAYELMKEDILAKVKTDSRGEYLEANGMNRFLKNLNIKRNEDVWFGVLALADQRLLQRKWDFNASQINSKTLLSIGGQTYTNLDFLDYAKGKQLFEQQPEGLTPDMYFRWYFNDFKREKSFEYVLTNLKNWEPTFGLMSELFKEDVISTNYLNDAVVERSVSDTLGQKAYYLSHTDQYQWPKKATATIIKANKKELITQYYEIEASGTPYRLKRGILPIYFEKEATALDNSHKRKLAGLLQIMQENRGFIVEIGGHNDINEDPGTSSQRIQLVVQFLTENGLPITRIREYDYGTTRLVDRFDWPQNQRISFQFFSNDKRDIADILSTPSDSIVIVRGNYFEGDNALIDGTNWETGEFESEFDGHFYRIEIEKIIPARAKTLKEARGSVIKDYQTELEKQLNERLAVKYPVSLDEVKLKAIFEKLKEQNQ